MGETKRWTQKQTHWRKDGGEQKASFILPKLNTKNINTQKNKMESPGLKPEDNSGKTKYNQKQSSN